MKEELLEIAGRLECVERQLLDLLMRHRELSSDPRNLETACLVRMAISALREVVRGPAEVVSSELESP
jgi:hypothetical protein